MDDPHAVQPLNRFWKNVAVAPRKDVDVVSHSGEQPSHLADVEVLTAAIDAAQNAER
jgi:hypothetical protein